VNGVALAHWGRGLSRHEKQQTDKWQINDIRQRLLIPLILQGKCVIIGTVSCAGCVQDFVVKLHDTLNITVLWVI